MSDQLILANYIPGLPLSMISWYLSYDVYLGLSATETMNKLRKQVNPEELYTFSKSCRAFLIESVTQIHQRFQFSDPVFEVIKCIDPSLSFFLNH